MGRGGGVKGVGMSNEREGGNGKGEKAMVRKEKGRKYGRSGTVVLKGIVDGRKLW